MGYKEGFITGTWECNRQLLLTEQKTNTSNGEKKISSSESFYLHYYQTSVQSVLLNFNLVDAIVLSCLRVVFHLKLHTAPLRLMFSSLINSVVLTADLTGLLPSLCRILSEMDIG